MGASVRIEPAGVDWVPELAALERAVRQQPWSPPAFLLECSHPDRMVLVSLEDGKLVGYVCGRAVAGEAQLHNLTVAPRVRRQGIGLRLLDAFLAAARARSLNRVVLEVRVGNEPALRLYRRRGFAVAGRRPAYYDHPREDAFTMSLPLAPSGQAL